MKFLLQEKNMGKEDIILPMVIFLMVNFSKIKPRGWVLITIITVIYTMVNGIMISVTDAVRTHSRMGPSLQGISLIIGYMGRGSLTSLLGAIIVGSSSVTYNMGEVLTHGLTVQRTRVRSLRARYPATGR